MSSTTAKIRALQAVIFDMDGVVTDTARVHAGSWKDLFDDYLKARSERTGIPFVEFDLQGDYLDYVDGKPRYQGVQSFLESRQVELPFGNPEDAPDEQTYCGLGNKKNKYFRERLDENGVEVFQSTLDLIHQLQDEGISVALVTSSANSLGVLERAGLVDLFEVRVDGVVAAKLKLKGKPNPDIFVAAADQLGVEVSRSIVIEDAVSGVQAGANGGFGFVLGVARHDNEEDLKGNGADAVVKDLDEVDIPRLERELAGDAGLPLALSQLPRIERRLSGRRLALFLDYDGTLAPIAPRPELAVLADDARAAVKRIAVNAPTAIVSGRGLEDVADLVQIDELFYAGNHGFEIRGPAHTTIAHVPGREFEDDIARFAERAAVRISEVPGAWIENKRLSLSVHYRATPTDRVAEIEAALDEWLTEAPRLRKHHGKMVFEIRPKIDWHKGRAVAWLLEAMKLDTPDVLPVYIGDDITDEDVFRELRGRGMSVLVAESPRDSDASYRLKGPEEVPRFLEALTRIAQG
jgi:alpha,alpha-trehalase